MKNTNTKTIEGNIVVFGFNKSTQNKKDSLSSHFGNKPIKSTDRILKLIQLTEFEKLSSSLVFNLVEENLRKKIILDIIATLRAQSDHQELSQVQKFSINGTNCLIVDNGDLISAMVSNEIY